MCTELHCAMYARECISSLQNQITERVSRLKAEKPFLAIWVRMTAVQSKSKDRVKTKRRQTGSYYHFVLICV